MGLSLKGIFKGVGKAVGTALGGVAGALVAEGVSKLLGKKKKKGTVTMPQTTDRIADLQRWLAISEVSKQLGTLQSLQEQQLGWGKQIMGRVPSYLDALSQYRQIYLGYMLPYYTGMLGLPTPSSLQLQDVLPTQPQIPTGDEVIRQFFGGIV